MPYDQKRSRPRAVPSSRLSRFGQFGGMAGRIAGNMALDGARRFASGERPTMRELFLTPANVRQLADRLARMRGAAMKVGQLVSMDAGDVLPPELADVLARLRADADHMPPRQLRTVLDANWGRAWLKRFAAFDPRPVAAASIGQVHRARLKDGRAVAIKVQYPGIRRSIDSDVDNVAALLRTTGVLPATFDMTPFVTEAKRQLHEEADYLHEAEQLSRFGRLLADAPDYAVPELLPEITTRDVLVMSFLEGEPIEAVAARPQADRDRVVRLLCELLMRELYEFRLVQTDPNFANYRYDPASGRVILLDFGATREIPAELSADYAALVRAGARRDGEEIARLVEKLGYVDGTVLPRHRAAVFEMVETAFSALSCEGMFDFGRNDMAERIRRAGQALGRDEEFTHVPPMDALYLQRKFAGVFLLASRLRARVDLRDQIERHVF